ncbi:MAG: SDR family oxidoreductase [Actinomycetota bacterium]|nr:SDR family oxidoreductase [Actinomycetota bacterium]
MKILVTGGAGFVGSHLCASLLESGHQVICLDNFLTGSKANIAPLQNNSHFELTEHDIRDPLPAGHYDFIYHLASPASPADYSAMPIETLLINSIGVRNVLDLAVAAKAGLFIASTSEVYGDPLVTPQTEEYWGNVNPVGIRSCYDEGKRFGEALTVAYQRRYGMRVVLGRIFNTFGPRMRADDGRAVPNFINQALAGQPLTVYGDGSQTRSFCYVDDMINAFKLVLHKVAEDGAADSSWRDLPLLRIVNLGNPAEMPVLELAEKIKAMCKSDSEIIFQPLPQDDPLQRRPQLDKAKDWLGYEPKVGLEEGLAKVIDWFKASGRLSR